MSDVLPKRSTIAGAFCANLLDQQPGRVAQSVSGLTHKPEVPGPIPGPATYFRLSFRLFKKGICQ